jgi:hypothetical protein
MYAQHAYVIAETRRRLAAERDLKAETVILALDYAWQAFMPRYIKISGPQIARVYAQALKEAKAGRVDDKYVAALAEQHARRLSQYFHETSRDAMVAGFNTYVNRRVPARAALEKALEGYGLTMRQMSGYTANNALETKVSSSVATQVKAKLKNYLNKSLRTRLRIFVDQESHNLSMQAEQIAWMWKIEHGEARAVEKVWRTAKDEKVCEICGPMHGKVVAAQEQFVLPNGFKVWVPGPHPNCRCRVRFRVPRHLEAVGKAWDPRDHPRGGDPENRGRFSAKARTTKPFKEPEAAPQFKEPEELKLDVSGVAEERQRMAERQAVARGILDKFEELKVDALLEQPETKPVVAAPPSVSAERRPVVGAKPKVGARPKVGEKPKVGVPQIGKPKVGEDQKKVAVLGPPRYDTRPVVRAYEDVLRRQRPPLRLYSERARTFSAPMYRVLDPDEVSSLNLHSAIDFTDADEWTSSKSEAAARAMDARIQLLEAKFAELREQQAIWMPNDLVVDGDPKENYVFDMDDILASELLHYVDDTSKVGVRHDNRDVNERTEVLVYVEDEPHVQRTAVVSYGELAEIVGVSPADLQVNLAVIRQGHMSEAGVSDEWPKGDHTEATAGGRFLKEQVEHDVDYIDALPEDDGHDLGWDQSDEMTIYWGSHGGAVPISTYNLVPDLPEPIQTGQIFQPNDDRRYEDE